MNIISLTKHYTALTAAKIYYFPKPLHLKCVNKHKNLHLKLAFCTTHTHLRPLTDWRHTVACVACWLGTYTWFIKDWSERSGLPTVTAPVTQIHHMWVVKYVHVGYNTVWSGW